MATQLLGSTLALIVALLPLAALTGLALVGDMIGEWGRSALLAYGAVLLGFLSGVGAAGPGAGAVHTVGGSAGIVVATAALFLGGSHGVAVLAAGFGILMAVALFRPTSGLPWSLLAFGAAVCIGVAIRYRFS